MFQISFLCKDSKLAEILNLLDGLAYELRTMPVRVEVGTNEPQSTAQRARDAVAASPSKKVTVVEIAKLINSDVSNVRSALNGMVEHNELKKTGRGEYSKVNKGA